MSGKEDIGAHNGVKLPGKNSSRISKKLNNKPDYEKKIFISRFTGQMRFIKEPFPSFPNFLCLNGHLQCLEDDSKSGRV